MIWSPSCLWKASEEWETQRQVWEELRLDFNLNKYFPVPKLVITTCTWVDQYLQDCFIVFRSKFFCHYLQGREKKALPQSFYIWISRLEKTEGDRSNEQHAELRRALFNYANCLGWKNASGAATDTVKPMRRALLSSPRRRRSKKSSRANVCSKCNWPVWS